jgi:CubicO group peptidase (beta-lactamase class C family)
VALFYQALLHNPAGLFDGDVLAEATGNIRNRLVDPLFTVPANRSLGLVVAGDDEHAIVRGFGRGNSQRAFGAQGVGGQIAWADPVSGLSFCYLTNGLDADVVASFTRSAKLAGLAARCAA